MGKTISISNHKGGVGKTTSTINIGAALHQLGKKVLLVDLDPQANLSQSLGIIDVEHDIYESLSKKSKLKPYSYKEGFDLIPSCLNLSGAEIELSSSIGREYILKKLIDEIKDNYDYILIDCPPSLGLLAINAFAAADEILIPAQAEFLSTQGLTKLIEVIGEIRCDLNKNLKVAGIIITQYDSRKNLNKEVVDFIDSEFKNEVFNTKIRNNIALAEAPAMSMDIFSYNPKSNGTSDYMELTKEILKREETSKIL